MLASARCRLACTGVYTYVRTVASGLLYHFSSKPALLSAEKSALNCHIPSSSFTSLLSDSRGYSRARVSSRHSVNAKRRAEKRRKTDMSCMHCLASKGSEVILCNHMFADSAVCAVRQGALCDDELLQCGRAGLLVGGVAGSGGLQWSAVSQRLREQRCEGAERPVELQGRLFARQKCWF